MDPATIVSLLYAGAAFLGAVTALVSVLNGSLPPRKRLDPDSRTATVLDRLSLLPRGSLRAKNGIPEK